MPSNAGSNMDLTEIMRLAQTPAGQKLVSMLQQSSGQELRGALEKASSGDYRDAQKAIRSFLTNPEAQALLEQLRRQ